MPLLARDVGRQRLSRGPFPQHPVAARATLEVDACRQLVLFAGQLGTGRTRFTGRGLAGRGWRAPVAEFRFRRAGGRLARRAIDVAGLDAHRRNLVHTDRGEVVAPGIEHVSQRVGELPVAQVAHAGHHAVVLGTVDGDWPGQAEQGRFEHFFAIASQEVGLRERRECAGQSLAVRLVAGGTIAEVRLLAARHRFHQLAACGFGVVHGGTRLSR